MEYRFCGLCGEPLGEALAEPEYVIQSILQPLKLEWQPEATSRENSPSRDTESERKPVATSEEVPNAASVALPAKHDELPVGGFQTGMMVAGPSFLGLANSPSPNGGSSYRLDSEPEATHKTLWVLGLVLLIAVGVTYAKWQPIRNYAITVIGYGRPKAPAAQVSSGAGTTTLGITGQVSSANRGAVEDEGTRVPVRAGSDHGATSLPNGTRMKAKGNSSVPIGSKPETSATTKLQTGAGVTKAGKGDDLVATGERHLYGRGTARSCPRAVSSFTSAAAMQNVQAFSHLGALYATGECVPRDRVVAYAWFRRAQAREPSNRYFERNLAMLWREMSAAERKEASQKVVIVR